MPLWVITLRWSVKQLKSFVEKTFSAVWVSLPGLFQTIVLANLFFCPYFQPFFVYRLLNFFCSLAKILKTLTQFPCRALCILKKYLMIVWVNFVTKYIKTQLSVFDGNNYSRGAYCISRITARAQLSQSSVPENTEREVN